MVGNIVQCTHLQGTLIMKRSRRQGLNGGCFYLWDDQPCHTSSRTCKTAAHRGLICCVTHDSAKLGDAGVCGLTNEVEHMCHASEHPISTITIFCGRSRLDEAEAKACLSLAYFMRSPIRRVPSRPSHRVTLSQQAHACYWQGLRLKQAALWSTGPSQGPCFFGLAAAVFCFRALSGL